MKLLDSSVAIDHMRGVGPAVELISGAIELDDELLASEIVRFELLAGVRDSEVEALEVFFKAVGWVVIDEGIARLAGALAAEFSASHSGIDDADYLIAATALGLGAELLTTNVRHFPMLEGLKPAY